MISVSPNTLGAALVRPLFQERSGALSLEKTLAIIACVLPLGYLIHLAFAGSLGARPVTAAIHFTGLWALRFLVISLAVTPVRRIFRWNRLILARRIIGLAALGYGLLHLGLFFVDQGAARAAQEIVLRPYLTIGAVALLMLLALGATSTNGIIRRLGPERWGRLHLLVYPIAVLGVLHFFIQSKLNVTQPVLMAGALVFLFGYRLTHRFAGEVGPRGLAGLAVVSALLTALIEIAWYGLATRVDPWRVLEANAAFDLGPSAMWWVLAGGLIVAALAAVHGRLRPKPAPRAARAATARG